MAFIVCLFPEWLHRCIPPQNSILTTHHALYQLHRTPTNQKCLLHQINVPRHRERSEAKTRLFEDVRVTRRGERMVSGEFETGDPRDNGCLKAFANSRICFIV